MPNVLMLSVIANSSKIVFVLSTELSFTSIVCNSFISWNQPTTVEILLENRAFVCQNCFNMCISCCAEFAWPVLLVAFIRGISDSCQVRIRIFEYFTENEVAMFLPEDNLYSSYITCRIGNCDVMYQYCFVFSLNS